MSANIDNIDLNSVVVSGEPENDVNEVNNVTEVKTDVVLSSHAETLMDSVENGQGQNQEAVVDEVKDFKVDHDLKEVAVGRSGRGGKMDNADKSVDLEGENVSGGGVDDASAQEVAETTETHSSKVDSSKVEGEENVSCKIEEEAKEGGCGLASSRSVSEDAILVKNADVEVKVDHVNDLLPQKEPGFVLPKVNSEGVENQEPGIVLPKVSSEGVENQEPGIVLPKVSSEGVENQAMEIDDERAKDSESENEDAAAFDEGVLQENENLGSNELNLDVGLEPSVGADGNATGDVNAKMVEAGLSVGDLVWGKVRSHPWWPGQIFGLTDASKKAKKYFKKDSYLIAYFWDQTFAWNEVAKIKPFRSNFSLMEKQSNLVDFRDAVHCALDEVSRRVELGLACPCMPVYSKIKTQIIVNPGIREESCRRDGGDNFSSAACFEPIKLIEYAKEYAKELGQLPLGGIDELEFVTARSQLLAFNRWKGYSHLPEFQSLGELLAGDAEIPLSAEVKHGSEMVESTATKVKDDESVSSGKEKPKGEDLFLHKRKHISGDNKHPSKKEKSLADLIAERRSSAGKGKGGLHGEATGKMTTSSSGKKRKAFNSISDDSKMEQSKSPSSSGVDPGSSQPKKTYRVGESILKVASQLNGSTPILKSVDGTSKNAAVKTKSQEKSASGKSKASPDELVSQLWLVARDPMNGCNFLKSVISFFVEFRNSVCIDQLNSRWHIQSSLEHISGGDVGKLSAEVEAKTSDSEHMKDSYWTDKTIQSKSEDHSSLENKNGGGGEIPVETPTKEGTPTFGNQSAVQLGPDLEREQQIAGGILDLGAGKAVDHLEGKRNDDSSPCPTALILNFTDLDAVPSETNLNRIFSHFGPLKESETQVLKKSKRAKVVFCTTTDAETAFSSAGKYSIFGPSLVSYCLKYITSTKDKPSPNATKCSRKDASPMGGVAIVASSSDEADSK